MADILDINAGKPPVCYSLHITHHWGGRIELSVAGISENPTRRDKESILSAAEAAVALIKADLEDNG
jgi:hypothetical protein